MGGGCSGAASGGPAAGASPAPQDARSAGRVARRAVLAMLAGAASAAFVPPRLDEAPGEAPYPGAADDALAFFAALALSRRNRIGFTRSGWVRKWTGPVDVTVHGLDRPAFAARLAKTLATLEGWTGLPLILGGAGHHRQIEITLKTHAAMMREDNPRGFFCITMTRGRGGALHRGAVAVSEDYTDCLEHELMHALGFDGHWFGDGGSRPMHSVLAMRESPLRAAAYTRWDELAIRTLYHPELRPGMMPPVARAAARRVLERLV